MSYIEPELREDRGEIEAALKGELLHLIQYSEVRGDRSRRESRSNWT